MISSIASRKEEQHWWLTVLRGLASVVPGVLVLVLPQIGSLRLLNVIAGCALVTDILGIFTATRLRKGIEGQWPLILSALTSVLFGLIAFVRSGDGAVVVIAPIANHVLFVGMSPIISAFGMRRWSIRTREARSEIVWDRHRGQPLLTRQS